MKIVHEIKSLAKSPWTLSRRPPGSATSPREELQVEGPPGHHHGNEQSTVAGISFSLSFLVCNPASLTNYLQFHNEMWHHIPKYLDPSVMLLDGTAVSPGFSTRAQRNPLPWLPAQWKSWPWLCLGAGSLYGWGLQPDPVGHLTANMDQHPEDVTSPTPLSCSAYASSCSVGELLYKFSWQYLIHTKKQDVAMLFTSILIFVGFYCCSWFGVFDSGLKNCNRKGYSVWLAQASSKKERLSEITAI